MLTFKKFALVPVLLASLALSVCGQTAPATPAHPNFSGRWRMDKEKSRFNGFTVPDAVIRIVDHHDPLLNLHTVQTTGQKTTMTDVIYFTDNSVTTNNIRGRDAQCRAYWDGAALVVRTKMIMKSGEHEVIEDRWELSADGNTLTTGSHIVTESGEANLTLVCQREAETKN
jgi:hypothetical protein